MFAKAFAAVSATSLLLSSAAVAQTMEVAAGTDLNLRAGPGPNYAVLDVIPSEAAVTVEGCLAEARWCNVTYEGQTGWAASDYLAVRAGEEVALLSAPPASVTVKTVTYEDTTGQEVAAGAGAATGAAAGALIAGPIGAVFGTVLGAAAVGSTVEPTEEVVTYVEANPVEPVILDGEVVVGAGIPEEVSLVPVPDTDFAYLYLNGQPVVVHAADRTIVKIIR